MKKNLLIIIVVLTMFAMSANAQFVSDYKVTALAEKKVIAPTSKSAVPNCIHKQLSLKEVEGEGNINSAKIKITIPKISSAFTIKVKLAPYKRITIYAIKKGLPD